MSGVPRKAEVGVAMPDPGVPCMEIRDDRSATALSTPLSVPISASLSDTHCRGTSRGENMKGQVTIVVQLPLVRVVHLFTEHFFLLCSLNQTRSH